jgi:hypothetical protein
MPGLNLHLTERLSRREAFPMVMVTDGADSAEA